MWQGRQHSPACSHHLHSLACSRLCSVALLMRSVALLWHAHTGALWLCWCALWPCRCLAHLSPALPSTLAPVLSGPALARSHLRSLALLMRSLTCTLWHARIWHVHMRSLLPPYLWQLVDWSLTVCPNMSTVQPQNLWQLVDCVPDRLPNMSNCTATKLVDQIADWLINLLTDSLPNMSTVQTQNLLTNWLPNMANVQPYSHKPFGSLSTESLMDLMALSTDWLHNMSTVQPWNLLTLNMLIIGLNCLVQHINTVNVGVSYLDNMWDRLTGYI